MHEILSTFKRDSQEPNETESTLRVSIASVTNRLIPGENRCSTASPGRRECLFRSKRDEVMKFTQHVVLMRKGFPLKFGLTKRIGRGYNKPVVYRRSNGEFRKSTHARFGVEEDVCAGGVPLISASLFYNDHSMGLGSMGASMVPNRNLLFGRFSSAETEPPEE